ncbi:MAG: TPM domain-containing protein [Xanthomonadaceae bacterium]|nr:TPM domain-containing protein [Xanthomonadaceae bacterium]MDE1886437.1 TPM domain-containing protein [Xanthomonadaceae bacterium]MDE1962026.1 TPM domain-containing protein [Xanthomonadaceae bacterium]MDE2085327.1 TPM domain-containing protein [Xanthomonadaceae bacterium]MDE2257431.1 TPM domain-containing protein [Xanthomonadaceae bacterium]
MRGLRHVLAEGSARRQFPPRVLDAIRNAIVDGEKRHAGQVMFAVEGALPVRDLLRRRTPRQRAHEVFAHLRVWDTHHNAGVLIYVLLADHAIEILADRGIAARVGEAEWKSVCVQMQQRFAAGEFERGAVEGVRAAGEILAKHFPADGSGKTNELPDRPIVL